MPNINNIDPFTGLGADNIVGGPGASNANPFGGPNDTTNSVTPGVIWLIPAVQKVREAASRHVFSASDEFLSLDQQSLGTSEDFSQPNPFDGDSNILIECSFEPSTLGQSDFFFF